MNEGTAYFEPTAEEIAKAFPYMAMGRDAAGASWKTLHHSRHPERGQLHRLHF